VGQVVRTLGATLTLGIVAGFPGLGVETMTAALDSGRRR
jgi:hypothetical protein